MILMLNDVFISEMTGVSNATCYSLGFKQFKCEFFDKRIPQNTQKYLLYISEN